MGRGLKYWYCYTLKNKKILNYNSISQTQFLKKRGIKENNLPKHQSKYFLQPPNQWILINFTTKKKKFYSDAFYENKREY